MISGTTGVRDTVDVIENVADIAHLGEIKPYASPSATRFAQLRYTGTRTYLRHQYWYLIAITGETAHLLSGQGLKLFLEITESDPQVGQDNQQLIRFKCPAELLDRSVRFLTLPSTLDLVNSQRPEYFSIMSSFENHDFEVNIKQFAYRGIKELPIMRGIQWHYLEHVRCTPFVVARSVLALRRVFYRVLRKNLSESDCGKGAVAPMMV